MAAGILEIGVLFELKRDGKSELLSPIKELFQSDSGRRILCAMCRHMITTRAERIEIQGGHEHSFANPHGIVFHIGCFRSAPGCTYVGEQAVEWSWFTGYTWRIAICSSCQIHLGWLYTAMGGTDFHGLILNRLTSENQEKAN